MVITVIPHHDGVWKGILLIQLTLSLLLPVAYFAIRDIRETDTEFMSCISIYTHTKKWV